MYYVSDYKLTDNEPFSFVLESIVEATDQDGNPKTRNNYQVYKIKGEMTTSMPDVDVSEMVNKQFVNKTGLLTGDKFQMSSSTGVITKDVLKCKIGSEVTITKVGKYEYTVACAEKIGIPQGDLGDLVASAQADVDEVRKEEGKVNLIKQDRNTKDEQTQRSITMSYVATIAASREDMSDHEMVDCARYLNDWIITGDKEVDF